MRMRIATWNVECVRPGDGARTRRIRQAIDGVGADVWVLTETHPDFSPGDGYQRGAFSTTAPDRTSGDCWVAVWVRKDWSATPLQLHGRPERSAAVRVDRNPQRPLLIFGSVLPWRTDRRHERRRGGAAFVDALSAQTSDWDRLREAHPDAAFCLAGDLNQELSANGPTGTKAGRAALIAALSARRLTSVTAGDFDPLLRQGRGPSIDHVVIGEGLHCLTDSHRTWPDVWPLPKSMPDHYGVSVDVADAP